MTFAPVAIWVCGAIFGIIIIQMLLYPMRIGSTRWTLLGDAFLACLCMICMMPLFAEIIGIVALMSSLLLLPFFLSPILTILVVGLVILNADRKPKTRARFTLVEILAVTVSTGSLPLLFACFGIGSLQSQFAYTLPIGGVMFLRAHSRLEENNVPPGRERAIFLMLYPYLVFGTLYSTTFLLVILNRQAKAKSSFHSLPLALFLLILVALATWSGWSAKNAARRRSRLADGANLPI